MIPITLNNSVAAKAGSSTHFLGICFDNSLTFKLHCTELISKLNSCCYQVRILRNVLEIPYLRNFYCACVQSRLSYGLLIWGQSPALSDVFLLQKRLIRCIFGVPNDYTCRQLFRILGVLPLPSLYIYEHLLCVFKDKHKYKTVGETHKYDTRNTKKLWIPFRHLKLCMQTSDTLGLRLFNHLPTEIVNCSSVSEFKGRITKYLLEGCFYSQQEFFSQPCAIVRSKY